MIRLAVIVLAVGLLSQNAIATEVTAQLGWSARAELGTLVSGIVREVAVRPGQRVNKGEVLLSLDTRAAEAHVLEARAAVAEARAQLGEAEREDERAQEMYDRTVLSDRERKLAEIALQGARATSQRARAGLTRAELDLEYGTIRAPFAALVLAVRGTIGEVVVSEMASAPLVVVAAAGQMRANAVVDGDAAARLSAGQSLQVVVRGKTLPALVVEVGLEPVVGTVPARYPIAVEFQVPAGTVYRAGEDARILIE